MNASLSEEERYWGIRRRSEGRDRRRLLFHGRGKRCGRAAPSREKGGGGGGGSSQWQSAEATAPAVHSRLDQPRSAMRCRAATYPNKSRQTSPRRKDPNRLPNLRTYTYVKRCRLSRACVRARRRCTGCPVRQTARTDQSIRIKFNTLNLRHTREVVSSRAELLVIIARSF